MDNERERCPLCGDGRVRQVARTTVQEYGGRKARLQLLANACADCGGESADARQMVENKRAMVRFTKRVDGLLEGREIRAIINRLGLSGERAAALVGVPAALLTRWMNDDERHGGAADRLLRVMAAVPGVTHYLQDLTTSSGNSSFDILN